MKEWCRENPFLFVLLVLVACGTVEESVKAIASAFAAPIIETRCTDSGNK